MTTNINELIAMLTQARAEAQAEADAAIDRHGALDRALAALCPVDVPEWVAAPIVVTDQVPAKVKAASERSGRKGGVDYKAIAAWINKAKRDGNYSVSTMAEHFGVTEAAAKNYPQRCRVAGLLNTPPSHVEPVAAVTAVTAGGTRHAFSPAEAMSLLEQTG